MENQLAELESVQEMVFNDLIYISLKVFEMVNILNFSLNSNSPILRTFLCLVLQLLADAFNAYTTEKSVQLHMHS